MVIFGVREHAANVCYQYIDHYKQHVISSWCTVARNARGLVVLQIRVIPNIMSQEQLPHDHNSL